MDIRGGVGSSKMYVSGVERMGGAVSCVIVEVCMGVRGKAMAGQYFLSGGDSASSFRFGMEMWVGFQGFYQRGPGIL
jgi:hypothetical protein